MTRRIFAERLGAQRGVTGDIGREGVPLCGSTAVCELFPAIVQAAREVPRHALVRKRCSDAVPAPADRPEDSSLCRSGLTRWRCCLRSGIDRTSRRALANGSVHDRHQMVSGFAAGMFGIAAEEIDHLGDDRNRASH